MTIAGTIRDWLATQDGPRLTRAVAEATGLNKKKVTVAISGMVRIGVLTATDEFPRRYANGKTPMVWRYDDPETRAAAHLAARKRRDAKVAAAKPKRVKADRAATKRAYEAKRSVKRLAERAARRQPVRTAAKAAPRKAMPDVAAKRDVSADVTAWLASGGHIEQLKPGAGQHYITQGNP